MTNPNESGAAPMDSTSSQATTHPSPRHLSLVTEDVSIHAPASPLTRREAEVLELVALGHSNMEIAQGLFLSMNTIKTYIRNAYRKIDVRSRTQAVIWTLAHPGDLDSAVSSERHPDGASHAHG